LAALNIVPSLNTFDTVLMGWNTYAVGLRDGLQNPYPHLRQYVFSRTHTRGEVETGIVLTSEPPVEIVRRLKAEPAVADIWLCGGGQLAASLASEIDQLVLKVNPVVLGSGIPLFGSHTYRPQGFRLQTSRSFTSGVVMNHYERA
jgi:dihydrofolate reductase